MGRDVASGRLLLAVAAPAEAEAVAGAISGPCPGRDWEGTPVRPGVVLLRTGIGKANAAGAVAAALSEGGFGAVINLGIAGALPGSGAGVRDVVGATACVFADEGIVTDSGWKDCAAMGFPIGEFAGSSVPIDAGIAAALARHARLAGPIATVSTCSGTDALAAVVRERTGAIAEAMEGAAVALSAFHRGVRAGELRVISNMTGARASQAWDIRGALEVLGTTVRALVLGWEAGGGF